MPSTLRLLVIAHLFIFCALAGSSIAQASKIVSPRHALQERYATARVLIDPDVGSVAFGPMTAAATSEQAAQQFIVENAAALGTEQPRLRLLRAGALGSGQLSVFSYQQLLAGLPVEYSAVRLAARRGPIGSRIVYAAGHMAQVPVGGFPRIRISAGSALASVQHSRRYRGLPLWTAPEMVVIVVDTPRGRESVRAWKFTGHDPDPSAAAARTFFVDVSAGRLVYERDEILNAQVSGSVHGMGSPDTFPDTPLHPSVEYTLEDLALTDGIGGSTLTDEFGEFVIDTTAGSLTATLAGPWVRVRNTPGSDLTATIVVTPLAPNGILLNSAPQEFMTSQVNAFLGTVATRNFYGRYQPDFDGLDRQIEAFVNASGECNAFFNAAIKTINFFRAGQCVNTAYSSVVSHEYGHFVVDQLGLRQGSFGEGFGDILAMLIYDDPIVGRDFFAPDRPVRDPVAAEKQYPCFGGVHDCGQVLSGVWWGIKEGLQDALGEDDGLELARQLFTDWSLLTVGIRFGRNSATPLTAVEVLTVDDDDDSIANGTPNRERICDAFAAHGIGCPGDCTSITSLRARCRAGTFTISANVVAGGTSGGAFDLTLDGGATETIELNARGRGSATWSDVPAGDHEVCIVGCGQCTEVTCAP